MISTRAVALWLLALAAVCFAFAASVGASIEFSKGPLEAMMGPWARERHFVQYRGGSSAMEANGQFPIVISVLVGLGALLFGTLNYLKYRYERDNPD